MVWLATHLMSQLGQKATNRSRAKLHPCPLLSESGQKPDERICPLGARSRHQASLHQVEASRKLIVALLIVLLRSATIRASHRGGAGGQGEGGEHS